MDKKELYDVAAQIKAETPKTFLLFDGTREEWVPKSQVEQNDRRHLHDAGMAGKG